MSSIVSLVEAMQEAVEVAQIVRSYMVAVENAGATSAQAMQLALGYQTSLLQARALGAHLRDQSKGDEPWNKDGGQ